MAGNVTNLRDLQSRDNLGVSIAKRWHEWFIFAEPQRKEWSEIRHHIFATDTRQTTNNKLPWKNTTTIPKLCQIRDNLHANYMAAIFPRRKWLYWEANDNDSNSAEKRDAILNYMNWVISQEHFKNTVSALLFDYIDNGNAFVTAEWVDETITLQDKTQVGYCGPAAKRLDPYNLQMNPVATNFRNAPKVFRSLVTLGEVKEIIEAETTDENKEAYTALWDYLRNQRMAVGSSNTAIGELNVEDDFMQMDGFHSYRAYLESDYCEILTFYGDIYDVQNDELLKNHVIMVVDRHKVLMKKPNPSFFGYPPIFHVGWRIRQNNLWAQSPLANLCGMQYRVDHFENLKADALDLNVFTPLKIKGYVSDFEWGPMARINVGDDGDVERIAPDWQVLQANTEVQWLLQLMEEMAGSPKEAMGFRTPGEKTAYEVQTLQNAASRIFQNKIAQFEEQILEPLLNAMLELARRNITRATNVPIFDPEFDYTIFDTLSASDITGSGRIKPVAARHFAEQAELIQNLTNFYNSKMGEDPAVLVHISALGIARLVEDNLNLKDYKIVRPNIRLEEEADSRREAQVYQEQTGMEAQTQSGLTPDQFDGGPLLGGQGSNAPPAAA